MSDPAITSIGGMAAGIQMIGGSVTLQVDLSCMVLSKVLIDLGRTCYLLKPDQSIWTTENEILISKGTQTAIYLTI